MIKRYKCFFLLPEVWDPKMVSRDRTMTGVDDRPDVPGLEKFAAFLDGFWLDESLQLCLEADGVFWIPASAICLITRWDQPEPDKCNECGADLSEFYHVLTDCCPNCQANLEIQPGNKS